MRCREPQRVNFSKIVRALCLLNLLLLACASSSYADQSTAKILSRPELARARLDEIACKLREITGWRALHFDQSGALRIGEMKPVGGSAQARELLVSAITGKNLILLEDASDQQEVVFCRVIEGQWKSATTNQPPVYVVQIDFADFSHLMGDEAARAAFNVGWGMLHELNHVVHDSVDAERLGEAGACEDLINRMRRECGLAERTEYYFTFLPGASNNDFKTRLVRIAFEQKESAKNKRKRYWLLWDATLVGGLDEQRLLAARM